MTERRPSKEVPTEATCPLTPARDAALAAKHGWPDWLTNRVLLPRKPPHFVFVVRGRHREE
jgi:hypothetical protein